jgi:flagellar basal-body rod protein FlgF
MIDNMVFVAMDGAKQSLLGMQRIANNLSNAQTKGFRADMSVAASELTPGAGLPTRVYTTTENITADFTPGALTTTGRDLDVAINGDGWFVVQSPLGGEALTRMGNLQVTPEGLLVTANGEILQGEGGAIAIPPAEKIDIGGDGTISIRAVGQAANELTVIDRIKLVKPEQSQLVRGEDGLFHLRGEGGAFKLDPSVTVTSGALESSNVNVVNELVDMIAMSRNFELLVKMMQTADENAQSADQLISVSS